MKKYYYLLFSFALLFSCNDKKNASESPEPAISKNSVTLEKPFDKKWIEGTYETKPEENDSGECRLLLEITKTKNGYAYFLKTKTRELKGIATFKIQKYGEKYLILEGIKWDEYEGDISHEEENDSISDSKTSTKELEIPVGIEAGYSKDTLTIQNYGNSMNSYTKLSECGRKYIQLIKSQK
ncbi:hypothetical protein [Flavobacterium sp. Root186]|uniref:hypothetical protein n=1 Tax=Flavobacterium sp. Root186 TaxID=1736485 RepID=UPI0006F8D31A|nr:hypothetical protein [Flavobacterium sp. Root186]KRB59325.1 hypothetical protein ASD98_22740 [Flavobacterium sp. Root186]